MVMTDTAERRLCCRDGISYFADVPLGLYVVRGDSTVLLGQIGDFLPEDRMKEVSVDELESMTKESGAGTLDWDFDNDLTA